MNKLRQILITSEYDEFEAIKLLEEVESSLQNSEQIFAELYSDELNELSKEELNTLYFLFDINED